MKIYSPCQGCDERYIGCHSQCDLYKAYKQKIDEQVKARLKERNIDKAIRDNKHKIYDNMRKRGFF